MTLEQAIELGRRMMACEGFEWRAGMVAVRVGRSDVESRTVFSSGHLCTGRWADGSVQFGGHDMVARRWPAHYVVPDPRDPGTVGHALAMMRALADGAGTGIPHCVPNPQNRYELKTRPAWGVMACGTPLGVGDSEVEAVIAAWEALS